MRNPTQRNPRERRPLNQGILIGLLLIGISLACTLPVSQIVGLESETPTLVSTAIPSKTITPLPTDIPTDTAISEPTLFVTPATSTPKFAPFCQPSSASVLTPTPFPCHVPIAEQSSLYCSDKVPYNLVLINEGSTYEVTGEEITCSDGGTKDGQQILTCTGPMAYTFDLRVCDPACAIPTFQVGTTNCPQNYTFNDLLNCCEQRPQPIDQNCVVLKLKVKTCSIDCSGFDEEKTCINNGYACDWNAEIGACQLRR